MRANLPLILRAGQIGTNELVWLAFWKYIGSPIRLVQFIKGSTQLVFVLLMAYLKARITTDERIYEPGIYLARRI